MSNKVNVTREKFVIYTGSFGNDTIKFTFHIIFVKISFLSWEENKKRDQNEFGSSLMNCS